MHCRKWCSALVVMAVAVWSWDASCVHCEGYCSTALVVMAVAVWSWDASCVHCGGQFVWMNYLQVLAKLMLACVRHIDS